MKKILVVFVTIFFFLFPLFLLFFLLDLPARKIIKEEMKKIKENRESLNLSEIISEKKGLNLDKVIENFKKEVEKIEKQDKLEILSQLFTSEGYDIKVYRKIKKQKIIEDTNDIINSCEYIIENFSLSPDEKTIWQYTSLFSILFKISKILRARCVIKAIENEKNKVFDDIFLLNKIVKFSDQPINFSTLNLSCLIYLNTAKCINDILNILTLDKKSIDIIERNLPEFNGEIYKMTIFRERAIYNEYFTDLMKGKKGFISDYSFLYSVDFNFEDPTKKFMKFPFDIYLKPIIRHNKAKFFYYLRKLLEIENLPLKERKIQLKKIEEEIKNLPKYDFLVFFLIPLTSTYTYNNFLTTKVYENLMFTSISIEKYRKEKGFLPEKIEKIKIPDNRMIDPYSDKMLNYKKEKGGYKIWSVGENGIDEGGVYLSCSEKRKMRYRLDEKDDIVWIIKK
ncbi:MAG: hypothetical protein NC926_01380 [Candidatus Omnitrophica bacterium]|nr:hypothetical protein [Candidatus Omnitrophota bacterium]